MPDNSVKDPRVYLAAERTLLAWIRTGLAMMGFGFVVARFGLFLREMQVAPHVAPPSAIRGSLWFGTALVLMGAAVNLTAALHHSRTIRHFREGTWDPNHLSRSAIAVAVILATVGLAAALYLLTMR